MPTPRFLEECHGNVIKKLFRVKKLFGAEEIFKPDLLLLGWWWVRGESREGKEEGRGGGRVEGI